MYRYKKGKFGSQQLLLQNPAFNLTKAIETLKKAAENKQPSNGQSEGQPETAGATIGPGNEGDSL